MIKIGELVAVASIGLLLAACGRNEPGTMGGEPGVPETVATGAPAQAARESSRTDSDQPALEQEQAASSFDDPAPAGTNAGTGNTNQPPTVPEPLQ